MNGVALISQRDGGVWHAKAAAAAAHASGPSLTTAPATRATTARPDYAAADRQNLANAPPPRGRRLWTLPLPLRRAGPIPSCLSIAAAARDTPPVLTLRGRPHGHSAITALLPARAEFIMLPFPSAAPRELHTRYEDSPDCAAAAAAASNVNGTRLAPADRRARRGPFCVPPPLRPTGIAAAPGR